MATAVADTQLPAPPKEVVAVQEKLEASGPLKVPLASPTSDSHPPARATLTTDQQEKYDWLLAQVQGWTEIPSTKGKAGPLTDSEKFWLTKDCLLRYLRATKWHKESAEKRLLDTLTWRREYGVEELTADHISPENETGKQILLGFDKEGRPCHYLNPGRQNTNPSPRQVQHLVFMVERVIDLMPAQQESLSLMINFQSTANRSNTTPGMGLAREVLHILQNHYPERLGKALIIHTPWFVRAFFKLITPFIDPHTREKLKFNEDMNQYVPSEQLWTEFNGKLEFEYDHASYWPALQALCHEKREARLKLWTAGGQQIGELEDYLAGHVPVGVAGVKPAEEKALPSEPLAVPAPPAKDTPEVAKPVEAKLEDLKLEEAKPEVKPEVVSKPAQETVTTA
ncbi:CRAL/TRIO domain-containing protein [Podospora didyma]|uniref:CRAL/TRIO domain-containing protein n=1 Tax=Podospora didyma TaxID=330526 RepID=A0AAE0K671_9PEZI|nr:CRAL/TRIO domain-containing protein [Podospora didyma]